MRVTHEEVQRLEHKRALEAREEIGVVKPECMAKLGLKTVNRTNGGGVLVLPPQLPGGRENVTTAQWAPPLPTHSLTDIHIVNPQYSTPIRLTTALIPLILLANLLYWDTNLSIAQRSWVQCINCSVMMGRRWRELGLCISGGERGCSVWTHRLCTIQI